MVITISITEFEFIALDKYGDKIKWLRYFLENIPKWEMVPPIFIYYDSKSAVGRARDQMYNGKCRLYITNIILLNNYSQLKLSSLIM